jgi:hypothetical protein
MATLILMVSIGWVLFTYGKRSGSVLPRSRKPFMPAEDRPPLTGHIAFSSVDDYVASGYQSIVIHLMQAARRTQAS